MCSLSERRLAKAEPPSPPHSTAVTEFLGGGVKQKADSGREQACSKFQHDGGLPNWLSILGISESTITSLSDPRGDHAFARALLLAGLKLPCDAARLQFTSSISAARAAEASLPVPRSPRASFLSGVSPVPGSRRRLSRFAASDLGLSSWAYAADFGVVS